MVVNPGVNQLIVDEEHASQRIDNFLLAQLRGVPKGRIYRMIRSGEVRVNRCRVKPHYRIQNQDQIRVPPIRYNVETAADEAPPSPRLLQQLLASIIYEDERVLVINKPAGVAVHGGSGIRLGVVESLRLAQRNWNDLALAHRLDRDTSGCLILAKRHSALRELHRQFREGTVVKRYLLLVKGLWKLGRQVVELPLAKNCLRSGERMVMVDASGKFSQTIFKPIQLGDDCSLLEAELKTGRTHQIRVHAAQLGYPIAGDEKYGDVEFNRRLARLGVKRLLLHAHRVSFSVRAEMPKIHLVAQLDPQLIVSLQQLGIKSIP